MSKNTTYVPTNKNNLSFYRDKSYEVDVLQEESSGFRAFEIKSAERFHPDFTKTLKHLQTLLGDELLSSQVIYNGTEQLALPFGGLVNYHSI